MLEAGLWHPVAASATVAAGPVAARLLERDLVLWRGPDGVIEAWADRCPHRGTRLSLGRIVEGRLECAYHGWRFDGSGRCRVVPGLCEAGEAASRCAISRCTVSTIKMGRGGLSTNRSSNALEME